MIFILYLNQQINVNNINMIAKIERNESPITPQQQTEAKVIPFVPAHGFRMGKGDFDAEVFDLFWQAQQPLLAWDVADENQNRA